MQEKTLENLGSFIRFKRIKKDFTQEGLAHGICSVTYLSKIENEKIIPNQEIIKLLLKRLGIEINDSLKIHDMINRVNSLIDEGIQLLEEKKFKEVEAIFKEIQKDKEMILNTPNIIYDYYIFKLRYLVVIDDLDQAKVVIEQLNGIKDLLKPELYCSFLHYAGMYKSKKDKYKEGLQLLQEAEIVMNQIGKPIPSLLYHMALTFSHLQNSVLAIYYTNESLKVYSNQMNYQRIIDCKMIIGINYIRVKRWEEAEKEFNNIMKVASAINNKVVMATVYHNLGYLYSKKGNHDAAMRNFQLSLDLKGTKDSSYFTTILYLVTYLYAIKRLEECQAILEKVLKEKNLKSYAMLEVQLRSIWFEVVFEIGKKEISDVISFFEDVALPYFLGINNQKHLGTCYYKLGKYYSKNRKYKLASEYFEKSCILKES